MIAKPADDKSQLLAELESLMPVADAAKRKRIEEELRIMRAGIRAEENAAYLINFDFTKTQNTIVIHDLRLEINGRVAQIDHLLIHRTLNVFVLETKGFHAGAKITEDGEFLRWTDWKKTFEGMPSPLAQNDRHIAVLKDAFASLEMPTRLGFRLSPTFHSVVVIDPKARIDRPKRFDTSCVVKADMLPPFVDKALDKQSALGSLARIVAPDTLAQIASNLIRLHRPATFDFRARFGVDERAVAQLVAPLPVPQLDAAPAPAPSCRGCKSTNISIQHGKFGYYFKCGDCDGNTPVRLSCGKEGHRERLRKDGNRFFRECADCGTSVLFYENG